ncbi:chromosome segregation protein Csm1/Pcs1-domain-containing protein, partial [Bombardia bombarda]
EITQKYESLELKYRDLRELAVKEAESNFDRLKKQSDEKSSTADQLIASLKRELAAQKEAAKETQRLKTQLAASEAKADTLQTQLAQATASLADAKTEVKALNMRLSAARSAAEAKTVPGSAIKGKGTSGASRLMKEDLYSDLTGLIVTGIKHEESGGEDVYDCLQTGRNGSKYTVICSDRMTRALHFKLAIDTDASMEDEAEFVYRPQLDDNRDKDLIAILPSFLVVDIQFPRSQAAKFYARVTKALTELPRDDVSD